MELIRVLLGNGVRPILLIAFTNHALDHMLTSVLSAGITSRIVRLGSRSADERISQYSMENMEMVAGQSRLDRSFGRHHRNLKDVQDQISQLMKRLLKISVDSEQITQYIQIQFPELFEHILHPPHWISLLKDLSSKSDEDGQWQQVGKKGNKVDAEDDTMYTYWRRGRDIEFLQKKEEPKPLPTQAQPTPPQEVPHQNQYYALSVDANSDSDSELGEDESDVDVHLEPWQKSWASHSAPAVPVPPVPTPIETVTVSSLDQDDVINPTTTMLEPSDFIDISEFFFIHGYNAVPPLPSLDRPLDVLLAQGEMWSLALSERQRLHVFWTERVRTDLQRDQEKVEHVPPYFNIVVMTNVLAGFRGP